MYNTLHCITRLNSFSKAHRREIQRIGEKKNQTKEQRSSKFFDKSKNQEVGEKHRSLNISFPVQPFEDVIQWFQAATWRINKQRP